jgi:hypothetical protein
MGREKRKTKNGGSPVQVELTHAVGWRLGRRIVKANGARLEYEHSGA